MPTLTRDTEFEKLCFDAMTERSAELRGVRADGIHMTDTIYCLTSVFYEKANPLPPTDKSQLYFAIGLGLESVLFPSRMKAKPDIRDGIYYSPDLLLGLRFGELKSTRMSPGKINEFKDLPETWQAQIMGYSYAKGLLDYWLAILYVIQPDYRCYHIAFAKDELWNAWIQRLGRKVILEEALKRNEHPEPFKWNNGDWECQSCQYRLRCGLGPKEG